MTIHTLLKRATFGSEEIERLVTAYEETLRALRLKDRSDPITQLVAEKIIAIGRLAGWGLKTRRKFPSSRSKSWARRVNCPQPATLEGDQ
jgi:hypothetical protein